MTPEEKIERRKQQIKDANAKWNAAHRNEYMRLYRLKHGDKLRAQARELRAANLEKSLAREKANRLANPEAHRRRTRAWQSKNKEHIRAYQVAYAKAYPEKLKASYKNAQAQRRGAEGRYTFNDIERIKAAQRGRCAYCRSQLDDNLHIDHIVALSRGGTNWPSNIQLTCPSCNMRKKAKRPEQFARELGMLI